MPIDNREIVRAELERPTRLKVLDPRNLANLDEPQLILDGMALIQLSKLAMC
ncbi:hypothetical protein D3C77_364760 [compost metagenome]